ncbi:FimV/HubP family polar landmark protein [Thiohalophilus sp.]|uniref:FimV/HubP family polar landmark protein n=1 Tax=Thiohalophilus sp. TaxID=3028392 RepID=UPI002ACD8E2D|nr:FimV/HubP family polar landmark protein [Thiohalophilus sp.]MDZ7804221.1 FimV/HubP family polar landmark protein [Thiohalophilus sp.]
MLRKWVVGLASACLILVPLTAQALGFGNIKLNSALNEPLDARIELISPTDSDIDSLNVKLASEGAFTRAGIDRPHFLNGLQFEVVEQGGENYIQIDSRESIREPFVNFLLEFSWDNGRMLREYTMLLDPPGRVTREPAPAMAETPVTEEPADTIERYEPQPYSPEPAAPAEEPSPMPEEPAPEPEPAADAPAMAEEADEPEVIEVGPATEEVPADEQAAWQTSDAFIDDGSLFPRIDISGYRSDDIELGELDYGVTKDGDNAWTIAEKLQSSAESASIYQIMMALLQSNPDAFIDGNVHRLKSGQVLRIEDPSLLDAMSRQQAANEYMAQTESWNDYRQAVAERTGRQAVVAEAGAEQAPVRAQNGGELTLSSPDGDDLQAGAGASEDAVSNDLIALQDELRQVRENAASTQERNVELNRQLQEMEEELARLQRSVSIKNDELAALQQQLAELNTEPALPQTPAPEETAVEESVEPQLAEEASEPEPAMTREQAEEEAEAEIAPQPGAEAEPAPESVQPPQEPAEPETPAAEEEPQAASVPQTDEPKGMVEEYLTMAKEIFNSAVGVVGGMIGASGNSLLMYVVAPVLLVLVILMLIVVRRRRAAEGNYQESILSGGPSTVTNSGEAGPESGESSFLSDFAVSGAGAIQTEDSEVDPLTEADVFMAYGRYEAAEERLQEAIEQEPGRKELKLKLLELYSATGNSNAFENLAEEFYASLGGEADSDPQWEKVVAMGKELVPNNPLFAAGAAAAAAAPNLGGGDAATGLSDSQVMDIGLDTGVFEDSDFAGSQPGGGGDSELDFNLDFGTESDTPAATSEESAGGMDFNLDIGSEPVPTEEQAQAGSELDFNLDMGTEATPEAASEADTGGMDFNLDDDDTGGGLDFNLGGDEASGNELDFNLNSEESDTRNDLDFNLGGEESDTRNDLEFNLDSGTGSPDTESDLSLDLDSDTEAPAADAGGLDFNLGEEDNTLSLDTGNEAAQGADEEQTMAIDAGGLDFGGDEQGGMDLDLDASDAADSEMSLGGGDEVGTKLDLARAYIDMGDPDGARSILDEVLDEGDDSQKQEAQQLIQQIA